MTKRKTALLLRIKYWTLWYMDHSSAFSYTGVTNFQKRSGFYGLNYLVFSLWYRFPEVTQRIFKHDVIHNINWVWTAQLNELVTILPRKKPKVSLQILNANCPSQLGLGELLYNTLEAYVAGKRVKEHLVFELNTRVQLAYTCAVFLFCYRFVWRTKYCWLYTTKI